MTDVPRWRHPLFRDPNYEWIEVPEIGKPGTDYVRGQCRHLEPMPVESVLGEHVAWLCLECDQQLPAGWRTA